MPHPVEHLFRKRSVSVASWLFLVVLVLAGCDGLTATDPPDAGPPDAGSAPCVPGELTLADGTCQPAGLPPDMPCSPGELLLEDGKTCQPAGLPPDMPCPPGELLLDNGTCQKAGVPPSACAVGFLPDGKEGCEPILPADPCPEGLMAIPGDTVCREVTPCGSGTWGDIPVEANTQFVNKSYAGGNSDGTQAKPWTTIQKGIVSAAKGAIVAVAAGSYPEDVTISSKAVRLWGRCPAMVEVAGTGVESAAIRVYKNAGGTEIHGVAVTGARLGIGVSGSSDVVLEGVWIHGTGSYGLSARDDLGLTGVTLKGSLVEQASVMGVVVSGSNVTVEASVVRSTLPDSLGVFGRGIAIQSGFTTNTRANVTVRASLIELNQEAGVSVLGSDATIEATVVRSTLPNALGELGVGIAGISVHVANMNERADVTVRACLVEQNHEFGVFVVGSDATIEATVIRSTLPNALGELGRGIAIQDDPGTMERADVTVRACLVEQNHEDGVFVAGSDVTMEVTVVRSTLPDALGESGRGITIQDNPDTKERSKAVVRACLVEQNHDVGVFVGGSDATIEACVVRSTLLSTSGSARGISILNNPDTEARANVTVHACVIEQNQDLGVFVGGSDATIEACVVGSTQPDGPGNGHRGINIQDHPATGERADVTIRACLVQQNHDAGVAVAGSDAMIESTVVRSTLPNALGEGGRGISIQDDPDTNARASMTVRACLVEQNHEVGVIVVASDATIEATVVRYTLPNALGESGKGIGIENNQETKERADVTVRACVIEQNQIVGIFVQASDTIIEATVIDSTLPDAQGVYGRGINLQYSDIKESSSAVIRGCRVEQNHDIGVMVVGSDATIESTIVRDTVPNSDSTFGDGISVMNGTATIQNVEVTLNARAGISSFGGQVLITGGVITCNGFDLEGEPFENIPFSFDGSTGWQCSDKAPAECTELGNCHVETSGIEAPSELPAADPLPPVEPSPQ